jgi:uncharacterized membrane protein YfhO
VVHVPAGHHHVVLKYWPRWLTVGIALNVLGVELLAVFVWWSTRRRGPREPHLTSG